jgi:N-acyl-D-aspartate/D-glutamate deacylase
MRSEGDRLLESIDELIEISRRSGAPAEIYHLKQVGRANWDKIDAAIAKIEAARASASRSAPTCTAIRLVERAWPHQCRPGFRMAATRQCSIA